MNLCFILSNQTNPYWNIAVENYLVEMAEVVTLYLWRNRRTVVIGQNQNPYGEVNVEALEADGGYLMRRKTGGGAVYHDDGNINFSFVAPKRLYDQSRQFAVIQRAVESFGLHTELSGRNDIQVSFTPSQSPHGEEGACGGEDFSGEGEFRKFSGNAFSKGRVNDLHHGTLLIDGDMSDLARYLKPKPAKLQKHGVSSVRSRVVNLSELNPDITVDSIVPRLREAFETEYGNVATCLEYSDIIARKEVKELHDHFASLQWKYGNWQTFNAQRSGQFEWGGVELSLSVDNGIFRDIQIASDALDTEAVSAAAVLLRGASTDARPDAGGNKIVGDILSLVY